MALGLVVAGAAMTFMIVTLHQQDIVNSRSVATRAGEVVLQRLTREIRQAQDILNSSTGSDTTPVNVTYGGGTSSISFYLPIAGSTAAGTQVTWTCTANASCTRAAGGHTVIMLPGVSSATFTPTGSGGTALASGAGSGSTPSYPTDVNITLVFKALDQSGTTHTGVVPGLTNPITVQAGVSLRNYSS
jgi:hypothetical protein